MDYLESVDYSFEICLNAFEIKKVDIDRISRAWAQGHFIYWSVVGVDLRTASVQIYSVASKSVAKKKTHEITKEWTKIREMLMKDEIPDSWVEEIIDEMRR